MAVGWRWRFAPLGLRGWLELARRGKSDEWIAEELGMDADEVLKLRQTQGLAEMFADQEFGEAWEADTYTPRELPLGGE